MYDARDRCHALDGMLGILGVGHKVVLEKFVSADIPGKLVQDICRY